MLNQFVIVARFEELLGDTMFISIKQPKDDSIKMAIKITPSLLDILKEANLTKDSIIGVKGRFEGPAEFVSIELVAEKISFLSPGREV